MYRITQPVTKPTANRTDRHKERLETDKRHSGGSLAKGFFPLLPLEVGPRP